MSFQYNQTSMDIDLHEVIFEKYFINCELADNICNDLGITRKELSGFYNRINENRKKEILEVRRIRSLFHNKQGVNFKFNSFLEFYRWYIRQHEEQNGQCYYCKTGEKVIATLFSNRYTSAKRQTRGQHLEIERRDAKNNNYSVDNCVLACYFCNNDKSDIFTEEEYFEYLKDRNVFFNRQFEDLKS